MYTSVFSYEILRECFPALVITAYVLKSEEELLENLAVNALALYHKEMCYLCQTHDVQYSWTLCL